LKQKVEDGWLQNFIYFLTVVLVLVFLGTKNVIFVYVICVFILVSILLYIIECRDTLSMLGSSRNVIEKIQYKLENYLKEMTTYSMEWKVGIDFYWLEVHYISKKTKKQIENKK
jgi:hypothetical protein